jgi:hypothetical protein
MNMCLISSFTLSNNGISLNTIKKAKTLPVYVLSLSDDIEWAKQVTYNARIAKMGIVVNSKIPRNNNTDRERISSYSCSLFWPTYEVLKVAQT